jgi:hypothetical protein
MGVLEAVDRVRRRVLLEVLAGDPIPAPAPPSSSWPALGGPTTSPLPLRVLSLNAWGASAPSPRVLRPCDG